MSTRKQVQEDSLIYLESYITEDLHNLLKIYSLHLTEYFYLAICAISVSNCFTPPSQVWRTTLFIHTSTKY